ncbi:MAG: DUF4258 domain-containing protein [Bacillota bacterium]|nr:DUF4258 domain-containing protein [Bacillota bacterium]
MDRRRNVKIHDIWNAVAAGRWALTQHARKRAGQRCIGDEALMRVLANGEILEDYPEDPRGPSFLVLGYADDGRPIHAVCAFDPGGTLLVITVYEPVPPKWINERTRGPRKEVQ